MAVREYIGARYVPVFAEPVAWDSENTYEPLTIVTHSGNSYTSKQAVPAGIDIANSAYWVATGNFNAQVEQYRAETANALAVAQGANTSAQTANETAAAANETAEAASETVAGYGDDIAALQADMTQAQADIIELQNLPQDAGLTEIVIFGDSWSDTAVPQAQWVPQFANLAKGYNVHNYSANGAMFYDGSMQTLKNQFINDTSFDKSKIACVIMVEGTNDYRSYTTSTSATSNATYVSQLSQFVTDVLAECPDTALFHHFPNYTFRDTEATTEREYCNQAYEIRWWCDGASGVFYKMQNANTRYIGHEMFSWFGVNDWLSTNYNHLTLEANKDFMSRNIFAAVFGGDIMRHTTGVYKSSVGVSTLVYDIDESLKQTIGILCVADGTSHTITYPKPLPFAWWTSHMAFGTFDAHDRYKATLNFSASSGMYCDSLVTSPFETDVVTGA